MWAIAIAVLYSKGVRISGYHKVNYAEHRFLKIQWGQAVNAFSAATSIVAGCRLILHLRESASPVSRSAQQLSAGALSIYHFTTAITSEA